jgi:hypothetical protein
VSWQAADFKNITRNSIMATINLFIGVYKSEITVDLSRFFSVKPAWFNTMQGAISRRSKCLIPSSPNKPNQTYSTIAQLLINRGCIKERIMVFISARHTHPGLATCLIGKE